MHSHLKSDYSSLTIPREIILQRNCKRKHNDNFVQTAVEVSNASCKNGLPARNLSSQMELLSVGVVQSISVEENLREQYRLSQYHIANFDTGHTRVLRQLYDTLLDTVLEHLYKAIWVSPQSSWSAQSSSGVAEGRREEPPQSVGTPVRRCPPARSGRIRVPRRRSNGSSPRRWRSFP